MIARPFIGVKAAEIFKVSQNNIRLKCSRKSHYQESEKSLFDFGPLTFDYILSGKIKTKAEVKETQDFVNARNEFENYLQQTRP